MASERTTDDFIAETLQVADAAGLPVLVKTPATLPLKAYEELAAHPLVLAVVGHGLPIGLVAVIAARCGDELGIYPGDDAELLPYLSLGAAGAVSPLACLIPGDVDDICRLYFTGRVAESLALWLPFLPLRGLLAAAQAPALKAALHQMGRCGEQMRPPLAPLAGAARDELTQELLRRGLL